MELVLDSAAEGLRTFFTGDPLIDITANDSGLSFIDNDAGSSVDPPTYDQAEHLDAISHSDEYPPGLFADEPDSTHVETADASVGDSVPFNDILADFFKNVSPPKPLVTGEVEGPMGMMVKTEGKAAEAGLEHALKPKGGAAASDLLGGNTVGLLGIAAGTAISGLFSMTGGLIETSMRDSNEDYMQANRISESTMLQQNQIANEQYMQSQSYNYDSALSAQQFNQTQSLYNTQLTNQESYYDFVMGNETAALAQAGLPSYLAYFPQGMKYQPRVKQVTPAGTSYTARVPGAPQTVAYTGSATQQALGYGDVSTPAPVSSVEP